MGNMVNESGILIATGLKRKKYLINSSKFSEVDAAGCPLVGQIGVNNKLLAYIIYNYLRRFSLFSKHDGYTIAVQLYKLMDDNTYKNIKR